jgi:L-serine dehydratase
MYHNVAELLAVSESQQAPLWQVILENEQKISGLSAEEIFSDLKYRFEVMEKSTQTALSQKLSTAGGLITGIANCQFEYSNKDSICGNFINRLMARALSASEVNASMGRVCAAPTAGACGILPAVLISVGERYQTDQETIIKGLLTASGLGAIITANATVSGAEGGCQAECGVAAAIAAAAAVQIAGGTNIAATHALCLSLLHCMGLVCDPIAGLVQVPCAQRNAAQAVNAVLSADLALAGMESLIPADEVIEAMYKVGKSLPVELRETAQGGIAATRTGKEIYQKIFG